MNHSLIRRDHIRLTSGQTSDPNFISGNFYCIKNCVLKFLGKFAIRDDVCENSLLVEICQKSTQLLTLFLALRRHKKRTWKKVYQRWRSKNRKRLMQRILLDKPRNSKTLFIMVRNQKSVIREHVKEDLVMWPHLHFHCPEIEHIHFRCFSRIENNHVIFPRNAPVSPFRNHIGKIGHFKEKSRD